MNSGIYTIENLVNGKLYIGYTTNFGERWEKGHKVTLKRGRHVNIHLQRAWYEYGEENFKFDILEECEEQFLHSQEHYWTTLLNVHNRQYGYNILPTHPYGIVRHSEETNKKMSAQRKGKKVSKEHIEAIAVINRIPVFQYTTNLEFIKEYTSMSQAQEVTTVAVQNIGACCKGKVKTAGGYIWSLFLLSDEQKNLIISKQGRKKRINKEGYVAPWTGKKHSEETKKKMSAAQLGVKKTISPEGMLRKLEGIRNYKPTEKTLEKISETHRGENNKNCKITEDTARAVKLEIKRLSQEKSTKIISKAIKEVMGKYGVSRRTYSSIKSETSWKHIVV